MGRYNFKIIEKKWQEYWDKNQFYKTKKYSKKKNFIA